MYRSAITLVESSVIALAGEGRQKLPPFYFITHVKGGSAAQISSMTSSQSGFRSDWEGQDEELEWLRGLVFKWKRTLGFCGIIILFPEPDHHLTTRVSEAAEIAFSRVSDRNHRAFQYKSASPA